MIFHDFHCFLQEKWVYSVKKFLYTQNDMYESEHHHKMSLSHRVGATSKKPVDNPGANVYNYSRR